MYNSLGYKKQFYYNNNLKGKGQTGWKDNNITIII